MVFNKKDCRHLKWLLWKGFKAIGRQRKQMIVMFVFPIILVLVLVILKVSNPEIVIPSGHHISDIYTTSNYATSPFPSSSTAAQPFQNCLGYGNNVNLVGLVGTGTDLDTVNSIFTRMMGSFQGGSQFIAMNFTEQGDLEDYVQGTNYTGSNQLCFALQLMQYDTTTDQYQIAIRYNSNYLPSTNDDVYSMSTVIPDWSDYNQTQKSGFLYVMSSITDYLLQTQYSETTQKFSVAYIPMVTNQYSDDPAGIFIAIFLPIIFLLSYMFPLLTITYFVAEEKENKLKAIMKMMGLGESTYILSWYIIYLIISTLLTILCIILLSFNVLVHSSAGLIFLFLFLFGVSQYGIVLIAIALCDRIRSVIFLVSIFSIISYFIEIILKATNAGETATMLTQLFPATAMNIGVRNIVYLESQGIGLTVATLNSPYLNNKFSTTLIFLAIDVILYMGIGLWFQRVVKSEYGTSEKWYFCLSPEFWSRSKRRRERLSRINNQGEQGQRLINQESVMLQAEEEKQVQLGNTEKPDFGELNEEDLKDTLRISNLKKVFDGKKVAVNDVTISIFKGQIFALLGHNGAGKTTTIQMLTGLLAPTSGSATVFGCDAFAELDTLQEIMGVCPQHDILFENLTVEEHLLLFANFKNTPTEKIQIQINQLIEDLNLTNKRQALAKTLSGGQKRKLSLAIALIGDSKLVLLDEPTSGMDPTARRGIWDMLKKYKENKIIILTTHYMDEADVLGDRIAIMSNGQIKCCGSSLFLKNKFGVGYLLQVEKKKNDDGLDELESILEQHIDKTDMKKYQDETGNWIIQLPKDSSEHFSDIFKSIDSNIGQLNIDSYTLRVTTLEEVFIKIGEEAEELEASEGSQSTSQSHQQEDHMVNVRQPRVQLQSKVPFLRQFCTLYKRRRTYQCREKNLLVLEVFFPIVYLGLGFYISSLNFISNGASIAIADPTLFPNPIPLFINNAASPGSANPVDFMLGDPSFQQSSLYTINSVDCGGTCYVPNITFALHNFDQDYNRPYPAAYYTQFGNYFFNTLTDTTIDVAVFTNLTSSFAQDSFGNFMLQGILRKQTKKPNLKLEFVNYPLPLSLIQKQGVAAGQGITVTIFIAFAYQMVASAIVSSIVKEKQKKIKMQLLMSGASVSAYWAGHYLVDVLIHALIQGASYLYITLFNINAPYVWVIFILYALTNPLFIYFWSHLFDKEGPARTTIRFVFIFLGGGLGIATIFLQLNSNTKLIADIIRYIFMIVPIFSLVYGLLQLTFIQYFVQNLPGGDVSPMSMDSAGVTIPYFIASFFLFGALTILIDKGILFTRGGNPSAEKRHTDTEMVRKDDDVEQEEERVAQCIEAQPENIQAFRLQKTYLTENKQDKESNENEKESTTEKKKKGTNFYRAVKDISFGVKKGECFVLLGINGAGKTTTFKCLIGEIPQTDGQLKLNGQPIESYRRNVDQLKDIIGYCPQYDPITDSLTVEEHLRQIGTLKGISPDDIESSIQQTMIDFGIKQYSGIHASKLSGGNKRKLCAAMALIGAPLIVFLDEQSAGVDPASRRKMWKVIKKLSKESAMIVTTHSMEEAEALASKVGIMVEGKFKCFGTVQHLKNKFGKGFEIEFKIDIERVGAKIPQINQENNDYFLGETRTADQDKVIQYLKQWSNEGDEVNLVDEFNEKGALKDFFIKINSNTPIDLAHLLKIAFLQMEILQIVQQLERDFSEVTMLDQTQNYVHLRVPKDNKSIGYMFGYIEQLKREFPIKEYSVSQTTLEQIFNTFAKENEIKVLNKRKTTTTINTFK